MTRASSWLFALCLCVEVAMPASSNAEDSKEIDQALLHPLFEDDFACAQHWEGQLEYPGDALGSDCWVTRLIETPSGGSFSRSFLGEGLRNEDWFSWGAAVLAPFDGRVSRIHVNPVVNEPGQLGKPPASMILFEGEGGLRALFAHVADIAVAVGDEVVAGQKVAVVGNNGFGRNPHIHVGAWRGREALQIRFDLRAQGAQRSTDE
ncbi:MAG: M23 family metallopeptidase [Acidobacteriota bacterium]